MTHTDLQYALPAGWRLVPFTEAIDQSTLPRPVKVPARDYQAGGTIPVIDQGQGYIAGWTDSSEAAIREGLPFIVFGDHTRAFKFVDFPFALGADGTQLLKPAPSFHPKYFYYACLALHLPSRGYNRHFTLLKEQMLPSPPLSEQEGVADRLQVVERAIEVEGRRVASLQELKTSTLARCFRSKSGAGTKTALEAIATTASGGTPLRHKGAYYGGTTPWIKSGELDDGYITGSEETVTNEGLANSSAKLFPEGTLLMAMYGATVGKTGILRIAAATNQAICAIFPDESKVDTSFLRYQLIFDRPTLLRARYGGAQPNISQQIIRAHELWIPDLATQREISAALEAIDESTRIHQRRLTVLRELFGALLDRLVSGAIRIGEPSKRAALTRN